MRIIITEKQVGKLLMEQAIFTDEKKYKKALQKYRKDKEFFDSISSLKINRNYTEKITEKTIPYSLIAKMEKLSEKLPNFDISFGNGFYDLLFLFNYFRYGKLDFSKIFVSSNPEKNFNEVWSSDANSMIEANKNFFRKDVVTGWYDIKLDVSQLSSFRWIRYWILTIPKVSEPKKPILQKKVPINIQQQDKIVSLPVKNKSLNPIVQPIKTLEEPNSNVTSDGDSVYGPAKSLIGFMKGRDFVPATGEYLTYMNKTDKELLNNKVELNKYLQNLYGGYANKIQ